MNPQNAAGLVILDWDHLGAFTKGDGNIEKELIDIFLLSAEKYLAAMHDAVGDDLWAVHAHSFKGAASGLGALQIAAFADLSMELPTEDLPGRIQALKDLREAMDVLCHLAATR